jgi:hypothetical protein
VGWSYCTSPIDGSNACARPASDASLGAAATTVLPETAVDEPTSPLVIVPGSFSAAAWCQPVAVLVKTNTYYC